MVLGTEQRHLGVGVGGAQGGQRGLGDDVVAEAVGPQHREAPDVGNRGSGGGGQAEGGAGGPEPGNDHAREPTVGGMAAEQRAAVVTGSGSGIGRAIVDRLHGDGWSVLGVDLKADETLPGPSLGADLTTREGNRAAVDTALEQFGRLDLVVRQRRASSTSRRWSTSTRTAGTPCSRSC